MLKKIAIVDKDEEYTMQFKKSVEAVSNEFVIVRYTNLTDFMQDKKGENFDEVLVDAKIKTKCKNYLKLSECLDDDKHIYKYKSVNEIINDIYRHMNKSDNDYNEYKDNVIIYDVSDSSVSNRSIDRFIKALGNDKKSFVWNNKMFTNDETEEGMDIVGALYNSTLLNNMKLESKLKQIDDKMYGFYPTKNIYELINFKDDDYNKIYKEISNENFEKIFVILSGDIKKYNLLFINNTKRIYLVYENDDYVKKNKIKQFFEKYIKSNDIECSIIDFNLEQNERKEQMKIANMVEHFD